MVDETQKMPAASPPPPPPPTEEAGNASGKPPWWKRPIPLWAVILIAFLAIGLGAASATSDEEGADAEVATGGTQEVDGLTEQIEELESELADREEAIESLESELDEATATTTTEEPTTTTTTAPTTTTTTAPPQPVEVGRFSGGSTGTETADFTVDDTWELQYSSSGGAGLIIEVIESSTNSRVDTISPDAGAGSSTFRQGGTYYLKVSTFGTDGWEIVVVDQPG